MNLRELFKLVDENRLVMPDFQRDYVWKREDQKALIASLILKLPIGSFLLLSGNKDDFATKELGFPTKVANPKDECKFLLDGQQRLTSLRSILYDMFQTKEWSEVLLELYSALRVRWFLRIVPRENESDIFGWKNLWFDKDLLLKEEPSSIEERLNFETVGKTLGKKWSNPNFKPLDASGNEITDTKSLQAIYTKSKILASKEGVIPLYDLYKNNLEKSMLLQYTIDNIADERKKFLKVDTKDNDGELIKILERIDPMISSMIDDENYVDDVWSKLSSKWSNDLREYLIAILNQELEIIDLPADQISRAVVIFERINRGGTSLDNFDLVVARAARNNCIESLNKRIIKFLNETIQLSEGLTQNLLYNKPKEFSSSSINTVNENEIDSIIKKQFLNILSIFSYTNYGDVDNIKIEFTKKDKILNISHEQINSTTKNVIKAINRACAFLNIRCGITNISELNYNLMMLPLAYLLFNDEVWNDKAKIDKLEYWYWGSILCGEYRYNPNDKSIKDLQYLYKWIIKNENLKQYSDLKDNVLSVSGFCDRSILLRENIQDEIPAIVHKTILQYILSKQPKDLLYDIPINPWDISNSKIVKINNEKFKDKIIKIEVQDHHIIPLGTATSIAQSTKEIRNDKNNILNSILNRTYILSDTNNAFSDESPSKYLKDVLEINKSRSSFQQHFISSDYENLFVTDNYTNIEQYKKFLGSRYDLLKAAIQLEMNSLFNS